MSKSDEGRNDAFGIMDGKVTPTLTHCVAAVGSDCFLREQSLSISIASWNIDPASISSHHAEDVSWVDVHDHLATKSLFDDSGHKTVILRGADKFVSKYREQMEKWASGSNSDATLILHLDSLPANTRLYKQIAKTGTLIDCSIPVLKSYGSPPDDKAIERWIVSWGHRKHQIKLTSHQARILVERIGAIFGLLDCELAKLALFASGKETISDEHVDELVGGWRTKTAWDIAEWIAEGEISKAWQEFDRLILAGQAPVGLMAQIGWSLRRFGLAANILYQAKSLGNNLKPTEALTQAGFYPNKLNAADQQLRRIGLKRALLIPKWLIDLELKLKGTHSQEDRARFAVEEFLLRFI